MCPLLELADRGTFWPRLCVRYVRGLSTRDDDGDGDASFDEDEASLRREIMELPKNVGARKVGVLQCARLVCAPYPPPL